MSGSSDLYFHQRQVGDMQNLAYLVGSVSARECFVVDPAWDVDALLDQAERDGVRVVGALVTHYHQDHIGGELFGHRISGLDRLMERLPVPIHAHKAEARGVVRIAGLESRDVVSHEGGDVLELGRMRVRLLHTPGHTPGSQCFLVEEAGSASHLVSGDTLFLGSCGRVDLPGSDPEAMYRSLHETLKPLPDETLLFPGHLYSPQGHGALGDEKRSNPFLRVASLETFLQFMGFA